MNSIENDCMLSLSLPLVHYIGVSLDPLTLSRMTLAHQSPPLKTQTKTDVPTYMAFIYIICVILQSSTIP